MTISAYFGLAPRLRRLEPFRVTRGCQLDDALGELSLLIFIEAEFHSAEGGHDSVLGEAAAIGSISASISTSISLCSGGSRSLRRLGLLVSEYCGP